LKLRQPSDTNPEFSQYKRKSINHHPAMFSVSMQRPLILLHGLGCRAAVMASGTLLRKTKRISSYTVTESKFKWSPLKLNSSIHVNILTDNDQLPLPTVSFITLMQPTQLNVHTHTTEVVAGSDEWQFKIE
jgi:hypothetical protein